MEEKPSVYVFAGPNGAGKTTFANIILPQFLGVNDFVNADTIARGLSAFAPQSAAIEAGRLMLKRLDELKNQGTSFAFETTLASRSFAPYLRDAKEKGYNVELYYVWVPSSDISVSRVAFRVSQGGHNVPVNDIRRRYERSVSNMLNLYLPLADYAEIHHNSDDGYIKLATKRDGEIEIHQEDTWKFVTAKM